MSDIGAPRHDPVPIGEIATPPFARLPDPTTLFAVRAERLRNLAQAVRSRPVSEISRRPRGRQHAIQDGLAEPDLPPEDARERARQFSMPPLDRSRFVIEPVFDTTLDRLFDAATAIDMPPAARAALLAAKDADVPVRDEMVRSGARRCHSRSKRWRVMSLSRPPCRCISRAWRRRLDASQLVPVGDAVCPVCGGAPVASVVVGWQHAANTRYCACSLCETWWHYVRIRCTACGTTKGIGYKMVEGAESNVQAETCEDAAATRRSCTRTRSRGWSRSPTMSRRSVSIILVREAGYRRSAFNPICSDIEAPDGPGPCSAICDGFLRSTMCWAAPAARAGIETFGRPSMVGAVRAILAQARAAKTAIATAEIVSQRGREARSRGAIEPAAGVQSHRHHPAHQSRPRADRRSRDRGGDAGDAQRGRARIRRRLSASAANATIICAACFAN